LHSTTNAIITAAQLENPGQRLLLNKQLLADGGCSLLSLEPQQSDDHLI